MSSSDVPNDAPEHCPGTASNDAGKASACAGCPNQSACQTAPKGPDPDVGKIVERLALVKKKILVLSGKGGVGKSTVSSQLAHTFAATTKKGSGEDDDENKYSVGLLDVDICGPSIPKLMGLEGEQIHQSASGWSPIYAEDNLAVMSVGFMLDNPNDAIIWRGPKKNGLIKQFLRDVDWGELDLLLVDTPPGTSDEHLSIAQYLKTSGIDGAILVTTPQEVALQDVRKEINFCRKVKIPILGVVENMSGFVCPNCKTKTDIFVPTTGGAPKMCEEFGVDFLGSIPIDPRLARACDEGKNYLEEFADSPVSEALKSIMQKVIVKVGGEL
eukprot:TRINITY_DN2325_c2_g2_i1.p1 TRINITY_DN2325_c2_g2~~TRINITY_DN2325_c2_g2_i1.p1  ORF type:complete len:328 (+),score=71.11 TRINITY_DN2325_c2_g2_i1:64-1047(+)